METKQEMSVEELKMWIDKIQTKFYDKFNEDTLFEQNVPEVETQRKLFISEKNKLLAKYKSISFNDMIKKGMINEATKCLFELEKTFFS